MDEKYISTLSNKELFRLIKEKFGIEVKDENDLDGAWQVVEKITEDGFTEFDITKEPPPAPIAWGAIFLDDYSHKGYGETAPLAICRAALLTMM